MKKNILAQLDQASNKYTTLHATRLNAVLTFFKGQKANIVNVVTEPTTVTFGRNTEEVRRNGTWVTDTHNDGENIVGTKFVVTTKTGNYSAAVPKFCDLHNEFCNVLGVVLDNAKPIVARDLRQSFTFPAELLGLIHKAKPFVSSDGLRPAMCCIMIEVINNVAEVIATNAHVLFISKKLDVVGGALTQQFLLPIEKLKALPKKWKDPIVFDLVGENIVSFCGIDVDTTVEGKFPDYKCVVPTYEKGICLDRETMIKNVTAVMPAANKAVSRVNFNFNGNIKMLAQDVGFNTEAKRQMPYVSKHVPDLNISFNGKYLVSALKALDTVNVSLMTASRSDRAVLLTDCVNTVLVMPLVGLDDYEDIVIEQPAPEELPAPVTPDPVEAEETGALVDSISFDSNKQIRILTNYLEHICQNYETVILHRYPDRLTCRYMKLTEKGLVKGKRTLNLDPTIEQNAMPAIEAMADFFEKKIIKTF